MPKEGTQARAQRLRIHQEFAESGQTIAEYARERGLTAWKVKHAVRKSEAESAGGVVQEVVLPLGGGGEFTVTLRSSRELRVPPHFSEKRVRQLMR